MSVAFRALLKKVGSGPHTSKDLTRPEAADAARMMLTGEATPAQIGAFLIAHRIKRPTSTELAGILDAYDALCPPLPDLGLGQPLVILGTPYDGRSRTLPVTICTALILSAAGVPVLLHGSDRLATKYGLPVLTTWQGLGLDFTGLDRAQVQTLLTTTNFTFFYTPHHFPQTQALNDYRDQIGKRPPLATVELMWTPYAGAVHAVAGFVHPPTEQFIQGALALRGVTHYTLIKGLEGSLDLPCDRTTILSYSDPGQTAPTRYKLHARDYGFGGTEWPLTTETEAIAQLHHILHDPETADLRAVIWNGGFYLWRCGRCDSLEAGFVEAQRLLLSGAVRSQFHTIQTCLQTLSA
ncbi:anthranilate phosphoribosyltransferase family protein [Spirulina major CS-329]|uniref:anthranilate phosphoribosyltransferase family protein n=1 Tax=Spirulina TaxID=1154 RepID=UPI002331344C|nr:MULTISPECIES: anthranilate phosphoribosyltransferase family protein [Spirulina]MDB9494757.1 anthranilate phosphoribosyltransferase family protein [Spirulina subsalsa CS-330]MDB9503146.1 anthranilate phosphoribosyltransferase family protein [Spirulina major CS-329]